MGSSPSEVALTLVVLAGAGVMLVSVARLLGVDPGLDPRNVLVMAMSLTAAGALLRAAREPAVLRGADARSRRPCPASSSVERHRASAARPARAPAAAVGIEGRPDPGSENMPGAGYSVACPDILRTLGITLVAGREFTARDSLDAPAVALINQAFARRDLAGRDGGRQALQDRLPEQRQPVADRRGRVRELPPRRARHRAAAVLLSGHITRPAGR